MLSPRAASSATGSIPGPDPTPQRPSWNYRARGRRRHRRRHVPALALRARQAVRPRARRVRASAPTHIPLRLDEEGEPYDATAEDAAYAMFELDGGVIVQMNSSWCVRVDRDELFELQVDGTDGSAVAGLRECRIQPAVATPARSGTRTCPDPIDHRAAWRRCPRSTARERLQACSGSTSCATSCSTSRSRGTSSRAARGVQLAELGEQSWRERRWVDVPELRCDRPHPAARGRAARALRADAAEPLRGIGAGRARASPSPPPTSSPTRWAAIRPGRPARLGDDARTSAATCGRTGCGVAEAMDTAQRGMGLDWAATQELIRRSAAEAGRRRQARLRRRHRPLRPAGYARRRPRAPTRSSRVRRGRGRAR